MHGTYKRNEFVMNNNLSYCIPRSITGIKNFTQLCSSGNNKHNILSVHIIILVQSAIYGAHAHIHAILKSCDPFFVKPCKNNFSPQRYTIRKRQTNRIKLKACHTRRNKSDRDGTGKILSHDDMFSII